MELGQYGAELVGTWWYWVSITWYLHSVSKVLFCLYELKKLRFGRVTPIPKCYSACLKYKVSAESRNTNNYKDKYKYKAKHKVWATWPPRLETKLQRLLSIPGQRQRQTQRQRKIQRQILRQIQSQTQRLGKMAWNRTAKTGDNFPHLDALCVVGRSLAILQTGGSCLKHTILCSVYIML